jgi:hypothetical protein
MLRMKLSILVVLSLLALGGCSAILDFNAFSTFDTVSAPKVTDYEGTGGLAQLATDLESAAVVDTLKDDPDTRDAIADYLLESYLTGDITTVDQQEAAVLYCDLYLKTTSGEDLVNNLVTAVVDGIPSDTTIQDLLASIVPTEAKNDPVAFAAMVKGLRLSNVQYLALADGLVDKNGNGVIDVGEGVSADMNTGDVAQKAAVAYTMEAVFQAVQTALPTLTEDEVIEQVYLLSTAPETAEAAVQTLTLDPYNASSTDPYVSANLPRLQRLFDCAGLELG